MKKYQRYIAVLLAVMLMPFMPVLSFAEDVAGYSENGLDYMLETDAETGANYAVITGGAPVKDLVIPAEIGGYPVREVAAGFTRKTKGWNSLLETLTIGEGIAGIGENAFTDCTSLKTVSLPESLRYIGEMAFVNIAAEKLTLPEAAKEASSGFWYCSGIVRNGEGWEYGLLGDGTAVITAFSISSDTLTIPETIDGIPVTMIARAPLGKNDYTKIRGLKKVKLPKGLKAVEHLAFEFCSGLTKVDLPAGVQSIGYGAFRECSSLAAVTIPEGVTRIGKDAFARCSKLKFPKLPSSLKEIEAQAFLRCGSLGTVSLPASVRVIGEQAFATCFIKNLILKEGLEVIGKKAFLSNELSSIEFPASLREIGDAAFDQKNGKGKGLQTITFKSMDTKIGKGVFGYDDGGKEYGTKERNSKDAWSSSTTFDANNTAFWHDYYGDPGNYGQAKITVACYPGSSADKLYQYNVVKKYLKISDTAAVTAPADKVLKAGLYDDASGVYELVIPEGVEEISDYALAGLSTLIRITVPSTLKKIGAHAFEQCTGLKEIALPKKGMVSIGEAAFRGCTELTTINIPDGITGIAASVFEGCGKLKTVSMPKSGILSIGDRAFADCAALATLTLNPGLQTIGQEIFAGCGVKEAKIPDSVTSIAPKAFYKSRLKTLKLPANMEEIPEQLCAFSGSLSTLTMPKNVKKIGKSAFEQCPITALTLPEGLETIGEKAFAFDEYTALYNYGKSKTSSKLRSLKIPDSLMTIEKRAFFGNDALKAISFSKKPKLTEIGDEAFSHCTGLGTLKLPGCIRTIGKSAFKKCLQLKKAELEDGITAIPDEMFANCSKLRELKVTDSVTAVGEGILKNIPDKVTVTCPEGSAMHTYMKKHYPAMKVKFSKK